MERRPGHSKLVYDKTTRTIVKVDPNPREGQVATERSLKVAQQIVESHSFCDGWAAEDAAQRIAEALDAARAEVWHECAKLIAPRHKPRLHRSSGSHGQLSEAVSSAIYHERQQLEAAIHARAKEDK